MTWAQQSPINLQANFEARAPKSYLSLYWATAVDGFLHHGNHGVKATFPFQPDDYLKLEGKTFGLKEFHFHHPSEHLLEGTTCDAELHIVHQNLDDTSCAVIGICLSVDPSASDDDDASLIEAFRKAEDGKTPIPMPLEWWLPESRDRVFRYEGSLTTEPYAEIVSWIVFKEQKRISPDLFAAIFGDHPQEARSIQARNRRYVIDLGIKLVIDRHPSRAELAAGSSKKDKAGS